MKPQQGSNRLLKTSLLLAFLLSISCFIILFFFIILPDIEKEFCYSKVGRNIGTEPNYEDIIEYIKISVTVGMQRSDAIILLEQIGEVEILSEKKRASSGYFIDTLLLKICLHPFNNITIYLTSDQDNELTFIKIEEDS
jgi:hypothetical protein